ncbi:MAG: FRG domain-containing protein [Butyrivibrio sp.]|nr:FRG domain-containing protein [Butyrivibrio sp.]
MRINIKVVMGLDDYFKTIRFIEKSSNMTNVDKSDRGDIQTSHPRVLWFRGVSDFNYSLVPSLFRSETHVEREDGFHVDYSPMHYAEDILTQHYIAKNYHFFRNEPSSRVEWLEVMQHHGVDTRALDWSESSVHSLLFAIEMFLDNKNHSEQQRDEAAPCVWVLNPAGMNRKIFENLKKDHDLIGKLIDEMQYTQSEKEHVLDNINRFSRFNFYDETKATSHMDYILNLSAINDEILRDRQRMRQLLLDGGIVNPYYYLLSRIYSDGHILDDRKLPPLAVIQPYHSERIRSQRGVFTIFPFYGERKGDDDFRNIGMNPDAMDNNTVASECLYQIIIGNPRKMAYELLQNGMNTSWLYPEMPVVSSEIMKHGIY